MHFFFGCKDESETEGDETESVATEGDLTHGGESDAGLTDAETKSEDGLSEVEAPTPEPDITEQPVVEEPQPPSPAPEELWTYLRDMVTSDTVVSIDELVEKLVTTVSSIPQPYLKSVVKQSIQKQKSIEEDDHTAHPEDGVIAEGQSQPTAEGELQPSTEGAEGAGQPPTDTEGSPAAPSAANNAASMEVPAETPAPDGIAADSEEHPADVPPAEGPVPVEAAA